MELVVRFLFRPLYLRCLVDPEPACSLEEEANLLLLPGIELGFFGRPAQSLICLPTTLPRDVTSRYGCDYDTYKLSSLLSILSHMNSFHNILSYFFTITFYGPAAAVLKQTSTLG